MPPSTKRPDRGERLEAYREKLTLLKERSSLREVMERELLMEIIRVNQPHIDEYPMLKPQQKSIVELLCSKSGHPGTAYYQEQMGNFITLLGHFDKVAKVGDTDSADSIEPDLINAESLLIKCIQGVVYSLALITDNFEELVLRFFGQSALDEYNSLIEKYPLDNTLWSGFVSKFVADRVKDAHKEIISNQKYTVNKEKHFLVIRFLFDDVLARLNPTDQKIDKTRIQKAYVASRTEFDGRKRAKTVQKALAGEFRKRAGKKMTERQQIQAARVACMDPMTNDFADMFTTRMLEHTGKKPKETDPELAAAQEREFLFMVDKVKALGWGAALATEVTGDYFFKALENYIPDSVDTVRALAVDFSLPTLEKVLFFLLESHYAHLLREAGAPEGGKIQVRSGRARRVAMKTIDDLGDVGLSKIRRAQLFAKDTTRDGMVLFKSKSVKQLAALMEMLSLEPELQETIRKMWLNSLFRVDIMVLINLEMVAKTTVNMRGKLSQILGSFGVGMNTKEN